MKTNNFYSSLLVTFALSICIVSCSHKKEYKEHESIDEAPEEQKQILQQQSRSQTDEPTDPEAGHKYLNGRDITNDKQTCTVCRGTGKQGDGKCPECEGYGYVLVYK